MAGIESPCKNVCVVDPASALCVGCGRKLAEIANWIRFSPDERRRIMAGLGGRIGGTTGRTTSAPNPKFAHSKRQIRSRTSGSKGH